MDQHPGRPDLFPRMPGCNPDVPYAGDQDPARTAFVQFSRRAAALADYRRIEFAHEVAVEAHPQADAFSDWTRARAIAFEAYLAAGGTLAELYGLEPRS